MGEALAVVMGGWRSTRVSGRELQGYINPVQKQDEPWKKHSVGLHDEINSIIAIVVLCSLSE